MFKHNEGGTVLGVAAGETLAGRRKSGGMIARKKSPPGKMTAQGSEETVNAKPNAAVIDVQSVMGGMGQTPPAEKTVRVRPVKEKKRKAVTPPALPADPDQK